MRRIALTVDVEAHPFRAAHDHIDRLIWGRLNGREAGIGTMMDMADRHGVPMTFFVDYPEYEVHGDAILDVAREIRRRGHDPEPHCHAEYLGKKLFGTDDPDAVRLGNVTRGQADRMAAYLVDCHVRALGVQPLACRSRGYELSAPWLDALKGAGFVLDASYSLSCKRDPLRLGLRGPFRFSNGLLELPIPFVPYFQYAGALIPWNFNQRHFLTPDVEENVRRHEAFLDAWFKRHGDDAVATLVMHSWSFWKMDDQGFFTIPDEAAVELFDRLLARLTASYDIVSLKQVAADATAVPCDAAERVDAALPVEHCPVCLEPASHFQDYHNRPQSRCPFCGSMERHRTLVDLVYAGAFGPRIFHWRDILHIAPGRAETLLLRRMYEPRVITCDIQPGCDLQADIQAMPELADNSFDVVLACGVFRHVRDLDKALAEMARVLRPGGLLLCSDRVEDADYGQEITDPDEQTAWYGREKWEQYGIGTFRRFGRKDWEMSFQPWFFTRRFKADDKITGSPVWWLACTPKPESSPQAADPARDAVILRSNAGRILFNAAHDPVQHFLPDYHSWQEFRQSYTPPRDLAWLRDNFFTLCFEAYRPLPCATENTAEFPPAIPASLHPYNEQSFQYLLPELSHDVPHGDNPQLKHMVTETVRWIDTYGFFDQHHMDKHTRGMVWHDTATAMRLNLMAYLVLRILPLPGYATALVEKLFRSLLDHFYLLCADHFFTAHNNHGWLQMFGLLSFCRALPVVRGTAAASGIAAERILALCERLLTPDGMLREHSPDYQAFAITLLAKIRAMFYGQADPQASTGAVLLDSIRRKMRTCLGAFITPDGELAAFGDSLATPYAFIAEEVRQAALQTQTGLCLLPHSGHAVLRLPSSGHTVDATFLALSGAFHSHTHKHCDDLSFVWSEGRQNILVDPGRQKNYSTLLSSGPLRKKGFFYAAPNCIYAESAHAHNVVEINGETWSRREKPYGALPLRGRQLSARHWLLEGEWQRPEGFRQQRRLILSPGRWLLVQDSLAPLSATSPEQTAFGQWFHLDATAELAERQEQTAVFALPGGRRLDCRSLLPDSCLTCHRGEIFPRLQGWVAETSTALYPAWALGWHQKDTQATFAALFSLIGPCLEGTLGENMCTLQFPHEETEHVTWVHKDNSETLF